MGIEMQEIQMFLKNNIKIQKEKLKTLILDYVFFIASSQNDFEENENIFHNIKRSKVLIINHYQNQNENDKILDFVIGFKNTVIIINQHLLYFFIYWVLKSNQTIQICFLNDTKNIFDQFINEHYNESLKENNFDKTFKVFNEEIRFIKSSNCKMNEIWPIIQSCIIGYLIKQSNFKLNTDREFKYNQSQNNSNINRIINEDEYINIYTIGNGSLFEVELIYLIKDEEFCLIKKPHVNDVEITKLMTRETNNYMKISHQYLPKYYGRIKNSHYPVIEFINGQPLTLIKNFHFSEIEKMLIIFQLLTVIDYLHNKNLIYRDLKPDNIIIDVNKKLVLIDFDRMIEENTVNCNNDRSNQFSSIFNSPEINEGNLTKKSDIYSIGQMIYFIIKEKKPGTDYLLNSDFIGYPNIIKLDNSCIRMNEDERPTIKEILDNLYQNFMFIYKPNPINIKEMIYYQYLAANLGSSEAQFILGIIYQIGKFYSHEKNISTYCFSFSNDLDESESHYKIIPIYYDLNFIQCDINKSIYYYSCAAEQNHVWAQYNLGVIFYENKYISPHISKAIRYFSLAANQNNIESQYYLGKIYYEGQFVSRDINKTIYYFNLASNNNHANSQFGLGLIYAEGKFIQRDINKAIYYYSLAAKQNLYMAQFNLGLIYYEGKYITQDITKAMKYFELAAKNNYSFANYYLGLIYYEGKYISQNIKEALKYFSLSAEQNNINAQFYLGVIYYEGKYISRDIKKAIYYFTLSANQNYIDAQFNLGLIYFEDEYISRDINKAIYYFTLSANQNNNNAQLNLGLIYYEDEYISRDINKAIYYLTLSANQNNNTAQFYLGIIYYEGKYIKQDIDKSIHYYKLAADQNYLDAQINLGIIYYEGIVVQRSFNKAILYLLPAAKENDSEAQYVLGMIYTLGYDIARDIEKAVYYFKLAANQNHPIALYNLGVIYYDKKYNLQDINKSIIFFQISAEQNYPGSQYALGAIYQDDYENTKNSLSIQKSLNYFSLAANQNHKESQTKLGLLYYYGYYIQKDINKAIYYFTLAANQNEPKAQYYLGLIYYTNEKFSKNKNYGIHLLLNSAENNNVNANFTLGFIFQEGKHIKRDIKKSEHYYKEASSFNNTYAKNNLGILYKHGFGEEILPNVKWAKIYFKEAIKEKNNPISMYNLAHTYIFNLNDDKKREHHIDISIKLLIDSLNRSIIPSKGLLCLVLIIKYGINITQENISKYTEKPGELINYIYQIIIREKLFINESFNRFYNLYKDIDFIIDPLAQIIESKTLFNYDKETKYQPFKKNITSDFYDGFGFQI